MRYKVGDRVLIRQWDDMRDKFGLDMLESIPCNCSFTEKMKIYCGETLTISNVFPRYYSVKEDKEKHFWSDDMIERRADMTKSELKSGMVVETKDGERMICIDNNGKLVLMNLNGENYLSVEKMDDDMSYPMWCDYCTIMKVFAPQTTLNECKNTEDIIWERQKAKAKEMTLAEIEKEIGYPVKIIKEEIA